MKVSDLIASYLADKQAHIFTVSGGANLHVLDSLARANVKFTCTQHEQAAAFAADAAARLGHLGCALVTSGPGATNLVTGIASAYYDSLPVLYLTGQQARSRLDTQGCRQIGFQQTPIVPMCEQITKYAVTVMRPEAIIYELDKALHLARSGRPGPVLVDIPDDLQREEVEPSMLARYVPEVRGDYAETLDLEQVSRAVLMDFHNAKRPVIIYGWGVRLAGAMEEAQSFARAMQAPIAVTWAMRDAFPDGLVFGTHGTKAGNLAVQNADYILSIGSRLDTKATSSPVSLFAPRARLTMVEIDDAELAKMWRYGRPLYRSIQADARRFVSLLETGARSVSQHDGSFPDWQEWRDAVSAWKAAFAPQDAPIQPQRVSSYVAPYALLRKLGEQLQGDEIIVSDTGNTLGWLMQGFPFKEGQRFLHPFNNTPMGYALPAALAASLATGRRVICITGDGSIMMSIAELATIAKHCQNVKVLLVNNLGHSMCRYTQRQWLGGRFAATATGKGGDLAFPRDFATVARGMGIGYAVGGTEHWGGVDAALSKWLYGEHNGLLEMMVDPDAALAYQVRFGKPLDEGDSNA